MFLYLVKWFFDSIGVLLSGEGVWCNIGGYLNRVFVIFGISVFNNFCRGFVFC